MTPVSQPLPATPTDANGPDARSRRYTPGFSDGVGDRLLLFDNSNAVPLEFLCFKREFSDVQGFEAALRKRVEDLSHFQHAALATMRGVEWLEGGQGLALVSNHIAGRRLSEILHSARGPVFALELLRQLTPGLVALQQHGVGFSHGVLTVDRIIVTREGRLLIVEPGIGLAIESLLLPASRLRSQLGLALPDTSDPVALDPRVDVIQLAFVALSLLLGRRLDPVELRTKTPAWLDEFAKSAPIPSRWLRPWFEHALQVAERPFENAADAMEVIAQLPAQLVEPPEPHRPALAFRPTVEPAHVPAPKRAEPVESAAPKSSAPELIFPAEVGGDFPSEASQTVRREPLVKEKPATIVKDKTEPTVHRAITPAALPKERTEPKEWIEPKDRDTLPPSAETSAGTSRLKLIAISFAFVSVLEAAFIAVLLINRAEPLDSVTIEAAPPLALGSSPLTFNRDAAARAAAVIPPPVPVAEPPTPKTETPPADTPALSGRFGGIRVSAPVELQVFEGGALVGSTAGPIAVTEGNHTFEMVNETLGYRSTQVVPVKAGQMVPVRITLPQGRININAAPWANVWIDGNAAGETPIANLAIQIGPHEIVFRHPQLGEQRQTAVVKVDGLTRISASFQR